MNRSAGIQQLEQGNQVWDLIVVGGGATGLGVAVDASLRGYKTLLLEQADFTKGTSSRSTKLVHGGVRYLEQGNLRLVLEALYERGLLLKNAPHLARNQTFVIPNYSRWKGYYYALGLKIYDLLSGTLSLGKSKLISAKDVIKALPTVKKEGLKNGVLYHDGQFDDSRLGINLAQTAAHHGATILNYVKVTGLGKNARGIIDEVSALDLETGKTYLLRTKVVVNATGVFADDVLALDQQGQAPLISVSQGTHIVLDGSFLPSGNALMIPDTSDGRVLFAIPWHNKVVVGTTDVLVGNPSLEPLAREEEIDFILRNFSNYSEKPVTRDDILSVFSGLRPLANSSAGIKTKEMSRNHKVFVSQSNLITITGGKWTTYRKMAEDAVNKAIVAARLPSRKCKTSYFKIHGYLADFGSSDWLGIYGSDKFKIRDLMNSDKQLAEKLHPDYPYAKAEVIWAARHEMARTVEDFLARRIRMLFLDAEAAIEMAPKVAELLAAELNRDNDWKQDQLKKFRDLALGYSAKVKR